MTDPREDARRRLTATRWVHIREEDAPGGEVYRDAAGDIPLSRRPREFLEFGDDGTVRKLAPGPDDRLREVDRASWSDADGHLAFRFTSADARGAGAWRVVEQGPDRLVIRRD